MARGITTSAWPCTLSHRGSPLPYGMSALLPAGPVAGGGGRCSLLCPGLLQSCYTWPAAGTAHGRSWTCVVCPSHGWSSPVRLRSAEHCRQEWDGQPVKEQTGSILTLTGSCKQEPPSRLCSLPGTVPHALGTVGVFFGLIFIFYLFERVTDSVWFPSLAIHHLGTSIPLWAPLVTY